MEARAERYQMLRKNIGSAVLQVKARRLKQLHWDKIRTPGQATVWAKEQPSVKLNFAELENLFQVCCPPLHVAVVQAPHAAPLGS